MPIEKVARKMYLEFREAGNFVLKSHLLEILELTLVVALSVDVL